jgi:hypothetical protein
MAAFLNCGSLFFPWAMAIWGQSTLANRPDCPHRLAPIIDKEPGNYLSTGIWDAAEIPGSRFIHSQLEGEPRALHSRDRAWTTGRGQAPSRMPVETFFERTKGQ